MRVNSSSRHAVSAPPRRAG